MKFILLIVVFLSNIMYGNINNHEKKNITLQLSWFDQFQFAGYYIAKEKGFYKEEDLNVDIKKFKFGLDISSDVSNGTVDFAIGGESLILERSKNKKIVALYALLQASPLVQLFNKEFKINQIQDLENKNSMNSYISKTPHKLQKKEINYNIFSPKDYGFNMYSDFLYTSESKIYNDIETVKKFKRASLKGWEYAYKNIEETVNLIYEKYNTQNLTKEQLFFEARKLKELSYHNTNILGDLNINKLQRIYDIYNIMGLVKNKVNLSSFLFNEELGNNLTLKEKEYIKNKIVTIGIENWEPIMFYNKEKNSMDGLGADFLKLIIKRTGLKIKIVNKNWDILLDEFKEKKIDILPVTYKTSQRTEFGLFSDPYFTMMEAIYVKDDEFKIKDFKSLENKKLAIVKEYGTIEKIKKKFPAIEIIETEDLTESIRLLLENKVDAFVDAQINVDNYLQKNLIRGIKPLIQNDFKASNIHFFSQKDDKTLHTIIQKCLNNFTEDEKNKILSKWVFRDKNKQKPISLSKQEKLYIKNKKEFTVCAKRNWMPLEDIENGNLIGISGDYLDIISKKLNINLKIKEINLKDTKKGYFKKNGCDIKSIKIFDSSYDGDLISSIPIFNDHIALITRIEQPFIKDIKNVLNQNFVMIKGFKSLVHFVKTNYPSLNIKLVDSLEIAHNMVVKGEAYGFIGTMLAGSYDIQRNHSQQLKVMTYLKKFGFGIGIIKNDKLLLSIINKAIKDIPETQKNNIQNKWISVTVEKYHDFRYFYYILIFTLIILAFIIYRHYILKDQNKLLEKKINNATKILKTQNDKLKEQTEELNNSLKNFKELFDMTLEGILIYEFNGDIISINKTALKIFNIEESSNLSNKNFFSFFPKDEKKKLKEKLNDKYLEPFELNLLDANKKIFPALICERRIIKDSKEVKLATIVNLSEIKIKNKLLQQQSKLALMGEMISMIAHQWRQPLNILGAINMRIEAELDFGKTLTYNNYLPIRDSINKQLEFMSSTIDDFRDFFKPKNNMKNTSLDIIVNKVLNIIEVSLKNKNINIIVQLNQKEEFKIYENELSQVILNLINNSVDALIENNIKDPYIKITTESKNGKHILKVKDNAKGVPKDIINKIFEPYFSTKAEKNGTGIGLYMSKIIIEDHCKGKLNVFNEEDGAVFSIII
jgi:signal transduction histidine kinase/ABC-type amino acid transport substrate-binding protein/ABC-type nitrate/sulfonate/bicarbonate transport system substrate-binding protein